MSKAKHTHARRVAAMRKRHAERPTREQVMHANIMAWLSTTPHAAEYRECFQESPEQWRKLIDNRAKQFGYKNNEAALFADAVMEISAQLWGGDSKRTLTLPKNLRRGND